MSATMRSCDYLDKAGGLGEGRRPTPRPRSPATRICRKRWGSRVLRQRESPQLRARALVLRASGRGAGQWRATPSRPLRWRGRCPSGAQLRRRGIAHNTGAQDVGARLLFCFTPARRYSTPSDQGAHDVKQCGARGTTRAALKGCGGLNPLNGRFQKISILAAAPSHGLPDLCWVCVVWLPARKIAGKRLHSGVPKRVQLLAQNVLRPPGSRRARGGKQQRFPRSTSKFGGNPRFRFCSGRPEGVKG